MTDCSAPLRAPERCESQRLRRWLAEISRRKFCWFMGATGAWGLTGCARYPGPEPVAPVPAGWDRGEERFVASTCLQCPGGCGIRVRVFEGRAVKIDGNREHPLNRGGLCPKGQAGLQALYDPDRIPGPMKKIGGRSSNRWRAITWEQALGEVATRLAGMRRAGNAHRLLILGGRFPGHMRDLFERFAKAFGTPNLVDSRSICNRAVRLGAYLQQGIDDAVGYDLEHTRFLMLFGANLLEAWEPTVYTLRCYGAMRRGAPASRGKVVVIDPRCGVGGSKADEWIPIRPGTDAALALGLAHVIVRDGLYDHRFVGEQVHGFEDWEEAAPGGGSAKVRHEGFRTMVLREYPPDKVEAITSIPARTIERLAQELSASFPSVCAAGRGVGTHTNGLFAQMAVHALNALCGSIDVRGGVIVQEPPPLAPWPDAVIDDAARAGAKEQRLALPRSAWFERLPHVSGIQDRLRQALFDGRPYPAEAALVYYTNPSFSSPDASRGRDALDRVPYVVSFSPFMDETTARADIVLPDATYLERLEDDFVRPSVGFPVWNLRQPVMKPLKDCRATGDVMIEIARRIGGAVAESFPWKSYEEVLKSAAAGLAQAGASKGDALFAASKTRGFWSRPTYAFGDWGRVLRTPTGKFELFPTELRRRVEEEAKRSGVTVDNVLETLGISARGDMAYLPHYEPPSFAGDERSFPLHLVTYKTMTHAEGRGGNQPWLQESFGVQLTERWEPWLEMNPETARELSVRDKDIVTVESERGRIHVRVRFHPGIRPDVVSMPYEYGHLQYGRWASRIDGNPNGILVGHSDPATGGEAVLATRVRVVRKA